MNQPFFNRFRLACLAVLVLAAVPYIPSMTGNFIWDDKYILDGSAIGGGKSLGDCFTSVFLENYYRPLVSASFVAERPLSRRLPLYYHQTNILIHVLGTAALMALLWEAFRKRGVALLGGLLFAVQPAQVGAVAWIGGRTDSMCALFMALYGWLLIRAARTAGRERWRYLALSALCFAGALFTKEQMVVAVLLVPLALRTWRPEGSSKVGLRETLGALIPYGVVIYCFALLYLQFGPPPPPPATEHGAELLEQVARTVSYYALLLLGPAPQWMHTMCLGFFVRSGFWPIALGAAAIGVTAWLYVRLRGRAPEAAWLLAFGVLTLLMVTNIYPVPSMLVTPYRAGVAGLAVAGLMGWALAAAWQAVDTRKAPRTALAAAACAFAIWCFGLTWWGASQWSSEEAIAGTIVAYDPDSIWARYNLTSAMLNRGADRLALRQMELLLDRLYESDAWRAPASAGAELKRNRRILARIHEFQGTRIEPQSWLGSLFARLGFSRLDCKDRQGAVAAFLSGEAVERRNADVQAGLGECAWQAGNWREAEGRLKIAVAMNGTNARARSKLGKTYMELGRWRDACSQFEQVIIQVPWGANAYLDLARCQMAMGQVAEAEKTLQTYMRRGPMHQGVNNLLAEIQSGRYHPAGHSGRIARRWGQAHRQSAWGARDCAGAGA